MAPDLTYFDPLTAKRVDGQEAVKRYLAPFAGTFSIEKFEMIDPKVQRVGDLAVLSLHLVDYGVRLGSGPKTTARWNSTEVLQRIDGHWKIIHLYWSYTKSCAPGSGCGVSDGRLWVSGVSCREPTGLRARLSAL